MLLRQTTQTQHPQQRLESGGSLSLRDDRFKLSQGISIGIASQTAIVNESSRHTR